jgi:formylglycine-generating enzyme required for sulfatase activity
MLERQQRDMQLQETVQLPSKERRFALIIGVDNYEDTKINKLEGAVNDARSLAQTLERYAGFPEDQVVVLTSDPAESSDKRARKNNILAHLRGSLSAVTNEGKNGLFLLAFAGHGKTLGQEAYLLPQDADIDDLISTGIKGSDVKDQIQKSHVEQVIMLLDACRSEPTAGARAAEDNILTEEYKRTFSFDLRNKGVNAFATVFATAVGKRAYEYDVNGKKRGYFSYALEEAVKGTGTANAKGEVTLQAVIDYVQEVVPKRVLLSGIGPDRVQKPDASLAGFKASSLVISKLNLQTVSGTPLLDDKPPLTLPSYEFETVKLDREGKETQRKRSQVRYFNEEIDGSSGLEMVEIPAGSFFMGSDVSSASRLEKIWNKSFEKKSQPIVLRPTTTMPLHRVAIRPFLIGKYEVTNAQWRAVAQLPRINDDMESTSDFLEGNLPVTAVSRRSAIEFCNRLSQLTGKKYRLPTEAEWEYACRAGTITLFSIGDVISPEYANYKSSSPWIPSAFIHSALTPVGYLGLANDFGLYDMQGNAAEWCLDPWHDSYNGAPLDGSAWQAGGDQRRHVVRGCAYDSEAVDCLCAARKGDWQSEWHGSKDVGFRVALVAETSELIGSKRQNKDLATSSQPAPTKPTPAVDSSEPRRTQTPANAETSPDESPVTDSTGLKLDYGRSLSLILRSDPSSSRISSMALPEGIMQLIREPNGIREVAFAPTGWVVIADTLVTWTVAHPALDAALKSGSGSISQIAFTPQGGWVIIWGPNGFQSESIPPDLVRTLKDFNNAKHTILQVTFTPNGGWVALSDHQLAWSSNVNAEFVKALLSLNRKGEAIRRVAFNPTGGWIIVRGANGYWANDIPPPVLGELDQIRNAGNVVHDVVFGPDGSWVVISGRQ